MLFPATMAQNFHNALKLKKTINYGKEKSFYCRNPVLRDDDLV